MRAMARVNSPKPDQLTPRRIAGYERLGWARLGLVGGGSRTIHGQISDVVHLIHERLQGGLAVA